MSKLRPWQQEALDKALKWLVEDRDDRHFLINAAPGAGKTLASCAIARALIERGEIERVIVIAPRAEVVNQWSDEFRQQTNRHMSKVTGRDGDVSAYGTDICATWAAVQGLSDALQAICRSAQTLVICDEHHHAAVKASWGDSADSALVAAKFVLVLTGTPIRSDGESTVWLAYDDEGAIEHPEAGTYTLTYGNAVDLGYCRPVTFHRHEGHFSIDLEGGEKVEVSSKNPAKLERELARIPGLQRTLTFYRLACTPQFKDDKVTPLISGYQATMLQAAGGKLTDLRHRMPAAGGLVIAPSIEMAKYMVRLLELIDGEVPMLVHSQMPNPEAKIKAFKNTNKRWLVSVAMVSEGVDIPRLRVLAYLPNAMTELAFRQAIGRVVRTNGPDDDTRAYVVMPSFDTFEMYARRVEDEMSPAFRADDGPARMKRCPSCNFETPLNARTCSECGHEYPIGPRQVKPCPRCEALNPIGAKSCQACGHSFEASFTLTLDEALRTGAIIRGMDLQEEEVREGESIAPKFREKILQSGDNKLVQIIKSLPEESWARLRNIFDDR
jgi:superfamily II DNA or RNA helicase